MEEANLIDEQKQAMAKAMEDYKQLCLKSFSINRSGEVIQKEALPMPRQITFEANPSKLQEMVDSAVNRALINQSGVLPNTVFNAVAITFKKGQIPPSYVGPAYHQPGSSSVTAPSATTAVEGTEVTSPPSTLGMTNVQSTPMATNPSTSEEVDFSDQIAQLALDPMMAIFEKSTDNERQYLKALFVKGRVDG